MNISQILTELRAERDLVEQAIASLERLSAGAKRPRRGRPPAAARRGGSERNLSASGSHGSPAATSVAGQSAGSPPAIAVHALTA